MHALHRVPLLAMAVQPLAVVRPAAAQRAEDFSFNAVPASGSRAALVILLEFPDTGLTAMHTPAYFESMTFGPQHPNVAGYFAEVSQWERNLR